MREREIIQLPVWTPETFQALMEERMAAVRNEETVIPMLWQGLLEQKITVPGEEERTAKLYVPKNCPQGTTFVVMNVPDGLDTVDFMETSGWISLADEKRFCLFVLEPGAGSWKTPAEEANYMEAGFTASHVGAYGLPGFAAMLVGYGEVGTCLQRIAMENPLNITSAVFIDASDLDENYVKEMHRKRYNADGYQGRRVSRDYGNLTYGDIPVPTWIISTGASEGTQRMVDYWKSAAKAGAVERDCVLGTVYCQNEDHYITPEGQILKVAYRESSMDYDNPASTAVIYQFLNQYYRYGQGGRANMISTKVDYEGKGIVRRTFTDRNGIEREYLVYVPGEWRDCGKKLPLVLAFHGAQQSMRNMLENGQWTRKAEKEGFIVAYPESTLVPMPNDLDRDKIFAYRPLWLLNNPQTPDWQYVDDLLNRLIAEFPVDEKRIYSNGHSMGGMMTNYLASGPIAHRFAAFGCTSGGFRNKGDCDVGGGVSPIWISFGEYDIGNHEITLPGNMADTIEFWLVRDGLATEETSEKVRMEGASENYVDGRYHHTVWRNNKGVPLVHYDWVEKKAHTHTAEENIMFWDNWFTKWSLDENGNRLYEGRSID